MLTQNLSCVQNLGDDNLFPYETFDPQRYSYTNKRNAKWKSGESGRYQAGAFNNAYTIRGKDEAFPAARLPGGPGTSLSGDYKEYFNHQKFRVVLSDWRGVGTSQPNGPFKTNTTQGLIEDVETMRQKLGAEKLLLCGGSWGATIAMGYAQAFPDRVAGLALRLPFLASAKDTEWNYGADGIAQKYPDQYAMFRDAVGKTDHKEILEAFNSNLQSMDLNVQKKAFIEWSKWEYARSGEIFDMSENMIDVTSPHYLQSLNRVQIMANYAMNDFFLGKEGIINPALSIPDVPTIMVANDLDPLQRPDTLDILRQNFPKAEMIVQENADWHWIFDPANDTLNRSNDFIRNGHAYATEKVRCICEGQDLKLVL